MMKTTLSFIVMALLIGSCNNNNTAKEGDSETTSQSSTHATVNRMAGKLVEDYLKLKNNLYKTDAGAAQMFAQLVLTDLDSAQASMSTSEQKDEFIAHAGKIQTGAKAISATTEIEVQRKAFNELTEGMYGLVKTFNPGKRLYYEFCPMANDDNGGYWLSESSEIDNPFSGDEMPHCGEVKETYN